MSDYNTDSDSGDDIWKDLLKLGGLVLGSIWGGKKLHDHIVDKRREPILKHLPQQNLSWYTNNQIINKFRDHNFYVTQFPMTPEKEFPKAVEILYFMLKYLGATELKKWWAANDARSSLRWRCSRELLQEIDQLKNQSLETIFRSSVIRRIFNLPLHKRIDVEFCDPSTKPIQLRSELREEMWTPGELYPYLVDN